MRRTQDGRLVQVEGRAKGEDAHPLKDALRELLFKLFVWQVSRQRVHSTDRLT